MCGIVGALSRDQDSRIDVDLLSRMLGAVRHRGPDQFGIYLGRGREATVGLGNARLSIIDLGGGQQPIGNEDGSLWIVFNGEIFNHIELRRELLAAGHTLTTDSDTEVILHLFEQHGTDCLQYLNGQFAIAIWNERTDELFLARDRVGIRPLYYTQQGGTFLFASEIKALGAHSAVSLKLDPTGLDQVFTFWSTLAPQTAFRDIYAIPPGHWLMVKPTGDVQLTRFWDVTFPTKGAEPFSCVQEASRELRRRLIEAVQLQLRADVPVGAYLSGGLDSSAITALVRDVTENQLETFSIAFTDAAYDESEYQQQMARHLGTRHHMITCSHADIGNVFPQVVWHAETPLLRTGPAPLYLLSSLVRQQDFKVVLTGEGADEFLAGYNIFKEAKVRRFWARQPSSRWRPALLKSLYSYVGDLSAGNPEYLKKFFGQGLQETASSTYSHDIRWRNTARSKRLFSPSYCEAIAAQSRSSETAFLNGNRTLPDAFARWGPLAQSQYLEATIFLPEYLLSSQGDRMLMAHSVEGRFPFLDHHVIEFCSQVAPRLKLCGLTEKYLLKQAVGDLLPEPIWNRPKRPYRAPIDASFFPAGKALDWVAEELSPAALRSVGYFDSDSVTRLVAKLQRFGSLGETDNMALAGVLSTQLLHRQFVSDFPMAAPLRDTDDVKIVVRGVQREPAKSTSRDQRFLGPARLK